jgi:hypothetical protein
MVGVLLSGYSTYLSYTYIVQVKQVQSCIWRCMDTLDTLLHATTSRVPTDNLCCFVKNTDAGNLTSHALSACDASNSTAHAAMLTAVHSLYV